MLFIVWIFLTFAVALAVSFLVLIACVSHEK
jgi:hypothetical protein